MSYIWTSLSNRCRSLISDTIGSYGIGAAFLSTRTLVSVRGIKRVSHFSTNSVRIRLGSVGNIDKEHPAMNQNLWYCHRRPQHIFSRDPCYLSTRVLSSQPLNDALQTSRKEPWTKSCGCCGRNSKGDKELSEFIKEELRLERDSNVCSFRQNALPNIEGFHLSSVNGPSVMLTKKLDDETITVRFNVNDSLEDVQEEENIEAHECTENHIHTKLMTSRPVFVVELNKGGPNRLALSCSYLSYDEQPPLDADLNVGDEISLIEIRHIAILPADKQWDENILTVSSYRLDSTLHDMLLIMLSERGIDREFTEQLVEFSTAYEHKEYLLFLQRLQDYAICTTAIK